MKIKTLLSALLLFPALLHAGETIQLFNGKDLTGWEGLSGFWSVKDGTITGQTTAEHPTKGNTFLIWKGGEVSDFELKFQYKITAQNDKGFGNSGVQYRSKIADPAAFVLGGYQADFEYGTTYSGILYEERGRGILAQRGQKVTVKPGEEAGKFKLEVTGETGKSAEIQASIKQNEWNDYKIVAKGGHLQHFINGRLTVDVTDETPEGAKSGVLGLQLHAGEPMTVQFRSLELTK
ncbi:MAG: Trehalose utilization [Verrucomicrobiales bacterium]|nr:Trehalose utilization [Verrucomicrobiales bacterium]